jgi:hypothetical protein
MTLLPRLPLRASLFSLSPVSPLALMSCGFWCLLVVQVIDTVASRGAESADILRKQGMADAVIACIDAPKVRCSLHRVTDCCHCAAPAVAPCTTLIYCIHTLTAEPRTHIRHSLTRAFPRFACRIAVLQNDVVESDKGGDKSGGGGGAGSGAGGDKGGASYVPDPATRDAILATVVAILTKLVTPEEVVDGVSLVVQ